MEKAIIYNFAFCVAGDAGKEGTFDSVLNLKYFIPAVKFRWHTQKFLWSPNFPAFSCGTVETWCTVHVKDHWFRRLPFNLVTKVWIFCLLSYSDSSAVQLPAQGAPRFFRLSLLLRSRMFGSHIAASPTRITVPWSVSTGIVWQFGFVKIRILTNVSLFMQRNTFFLIQVCLFVSYKYCNICHIHFVIRTFKRYNYAHSHFLSKKQGYNLRLNISAKYNLPSEANVTHPMKKFSAFYEVQNSIPYPYLELHTFNAQPDFQCGPR